MRFLYSILLILSVLIYSNFVYGIEGPEIIKKVKQKYESIESFSAQFTQTFKWKLADEVHQQQGKIFLGDNDKFRIETNDQLIVSDGHTLWTQSNINNQVIIDNLKDTDETLLPREIFLKFSEEYNPMFLKEEKINDIECYVVRLIPKNENVFIKEMKVWVDEKSWLTLKIENVDINGNVTIYSLNDISINTKLNNKLFNYQKKDQIEVIDMR